MDHKQKIEQFKISIRRRQVNEKFANRRIKQQVYQLQENHIQDIIAKIQEMFTNSSAIQLYSQVAEIRQFSQNQRIVNVLKDYFEGFYRLLIEVDSHIQFKEKSDEIYSHVCTILINIISIESIDFTSEIKGNIALPVIDNMKNRNRQIDTIWFIANILYRKNSLSHHFMQILISNDIQKYISTRINYSFSSQSEATIFYYFVGALTGNLDYIEKFSIFKKILEVINSMSKLQLQQCYLYILDGLALYAGSFGMHEYEIFATNILKKCSIYCKAKKSRQVSRYLTIILNFITGQIKSLDKVGQDKRKKILSQQYKRFLKNNFLIDMSFCLENRLPQIKKKLLEIAWMLIAFYFEQIDLQQEFLYLNLAQQIKNVEKYDQSFVLLVLRYMQILIISLLNIGKSHNKLQFSESFINFIENNSFFYKIEFILKQYDFSFDIVNYCFDILAYLQDYRIDHLKQALKKTNILHVLESLQIYQEKLMKKRDILIQYILTQSSEIRQI